MKVKTLPLLLLGLLSSCISPVVVQVKWQQPGKQPTYRRVEFETYTRTEEGEGVQVVMEHEESYPPWELKRDYLGETLAFTFRPTVPGGEPEPIVDGFYRLRTHLFVKPTLVEGTVTPVAEDPDSPGDFKVVFELYDLGALVSVLTLRGRLR
jgi:hypothetical protein